jgi:ferritin-like metal-binding protein YciE
MGGFNEWLNENEEHLREPISDIELHQLISKHREATREDISRLTYHLHRKIRNTDVEADLKPVISKILDLHTRLSRRFEEIDYQIRLRLDQEDN